MERLLLALFISAHLLLLTAASLVPAGLFMMPIKVKQRDKIAPVIIGLDLEAVGVSWRAQGRTVALRCPFPVFFLLDLEMMLAMPAPKLWP